MKRLLQAIFNESISGETCRQIRAFGFDGVRIDAQQITSRAGMAALLDPVLDAGLWPLVIVRDGTMCAWLPRGTAIELRNEPDLEGPSPIGYRQLLFGMREVANHFGLELWAGSISNLTDRGFAYLRAIADALPERVSVHWYPHRPWLQGRGHEGRTRAEEIAILRSIIGDRQIGVTEVGFHTARVCSGWWIFRRCRALTDQQARAAIHAEFACWERQGAALCCLYQLNDAEPELPINRYGIRAVSGAWKPQACAMFSPR